MIESMIIAGCMLVALYMTACSDKLTFSRCMSLIWRPCRADDNRKGEEANRCRLQEAASIRTQILHQVLPTDRQRASHGERYGFVAERPVPTEETLGSITGHLAQTSRK